MKLARKILATAVGAAFMGLATSVSALPFAPGQNTLIDDDVEFWLDADSSGTITSGDYFVGIANFGEIERISLGDSVAIGNGTYNELTAIFALEVDTVNVTGGVNAICGGLGGGVAIPSGCSQFDLTTPTTTDFVGVMAAFAAATGIDFDGNTAAVAFGGLGLSSDAWLLAYEDSTPNFDIGETDLQTIVNASIDGVFSLEAGGRLPGLNAALPFADSSGPTNPLEIPGITGQIGDDQQIGGFNVYGAKINQTLLPLDLDEGIAGSGRVVTNSNGEFPIYTQTRFNVTAVPAPGAIALFGAGLLGLGWARRGRKLTSP